MRQKWFFRLSLFSCVFAVVVVMLGAWTRLVDAGLGCPDWPGCYGFLTVPQTPEQIAIAEARFPEAPVEVEKGWPEMIHRYFASTLGLLIIGLTVLAIKSRRETESAQLPVGHSVGLLVLVVCQGLFGMWTVTLKLWPQVVSAHLLGGFATLSLLFLLVQRQRHNSPLSDVGLSTQIGSAKRWVSLGLGLVVAQIFLGAWTAANYAALACGDSFPTCQGQWWPDMDMGGGFNFTQTIGPNYLGGLFDNESRVAIQMVHRIGALVLTAYLVGLYLWLNRRTASSVLRGAANTMLGILVLQLVLGISNVIWLVPLEIAVAHNAVGAMLLLAMVNLRFHLQRVPYNKNREVAHESTQPAV
ncbi:MAG: COX15/CtaA family protein [Oleiphilaceae bacterium]|nr:COX15/CtaA family protein [Oleiphilaceae bacterium]